MSSSTAYISLKVKTKLRVRRAHTHTHTALNRNSLQCSNLQGKARRGVISMNDAARLSAKFFFSFTLRRQKKKKKSRIVKRRRFDSKWAGVNLPSRTESQKGVLKILVRRFFLYSAIYFLFPSICFDMVHKVAPTPEGAEGR